MGCVNVSADVTEVRDGRFSSRTESDVVLNKISGSAPVLPSERLPCGSAVVWAGSVNTVVGPPTLENNVLGIEESVSTDFWSGGWSVANARKFEWDSETTSSTPDSMSILQACDGSGKLTEGVLSREQLGYVHIARRVGE